MGAPALREEGARSAQSGQPRPPSLWRNRDYMLLWSGQTVSSVGTLVSGLAFPLLILAITRSPLVAGIAGALRALPYLLFSLPVGALIDRWNRKRVMLLCDAGRAIALGSIPVALAFERLTVAQIYAVALVEGTLFVFFNLAEVACLPRVVATEQLPAATAQNQATDSIAGLVGPSLSGVLYSASHALPFVADAVSYAVSVVSLLFIRTEFQGERTAPRRRLRVEIGEGLAWLWRHPLIRYIALLTGGWNFVTAGEILIVIVLAQHLGANPLVIGVLFAIGGLGGIVGAIIAPRLKERLSFSQAIIGSTCVGALTWPLLILAPNVLVLGLIEAVQFTTGPLYNVVQFSYRLALIPDELQGRVNSVFRLLAFGFQPLGLAVTGYLLQAKGPVTTVLCFSAVMLALAISCTLNPHVRAAGKRTTSAQPA
jgi:MFS family permease